MSFCVRRGWTLLGLVAAIGLATPACSTDHRKLAGDRLASKGLSEVELEPVEDVPHAFDFEGQRDGERCSGRITVMAMPGSSKANYDTKMACEQPRSNDEDAEASDEDPFAELGAACDDGDLEACTELGVELREAPPGQRDLDRAREVHRKACEGGRMVSCTELGDLAFRGLGGSEDQERAEELFERACEADHVPGCTHLGRVRYLGRDFDDARKLFDEACEEGNLAACNGKAKLVRDGRGGERDPQGARNLFQRICEAGEPKACANLATMLADGVGGRKDRERARELLETACDEDVSMACDRLRELR